jgi:uncharacterized protein YdhG (YjbR/CyaY superfamily)
MKAKPKSTRSSTFSEEERAAIQDRAREMKAASRRGAGPAAAEVESEVLAKIAEMTGSDRVMGERLHALIKASAPALTPRLWYGQPAYAKDGTMICFFQPAAKFRTRYATFGFSDKAKLDDGAMWPTYYALTELTPAVEARIAELVRRAAS